MTPEQEKTYLETRLRNLKRKYAHQIQHADLLEETLETKNQINNTINELSKL